VATPSAGETKRGRGRPIKLTRDLIDRIAQVVRVGNYLDTAARYCGVSKVTFYLWMKKGHAQERGLYRDFLNALEEAQAAADVRDHALIAKASEKDWRAAVEHLRLRNPGRYTARRLAPEETQAPATTRVPQELLVRALTRLAGDDDTAGAPPAPSTPDALPQGDDDGDSD
jgi:hypothetical protein